VQADYFDDFFDGLVALRPPRFYAALTLGTYRRTCIHNIMVPEILWIKSWHHKIARLRRGMMLE
jgi:hypothetical protein